MIISHVGCFLDDPGNRDLPSAGSVANPTSLAAATIEEAVAQCARLCTGFQYMGLQSANECRCGDSFGSHGSADDDMCGSCGINPGLDTCVGRNSIHQLEFVNTSEYVIKVEGAHPVTAVQGVSPLASCIAVDIDECEASDGSEACTGACTYRPASDSLTYGCNTCSTGTEHFWSIIDSSQHNLEAHGYGSTNDSAVRLLHETCQNCPAGKYDHDLYPGSACEDCAPGTFSISTISCDSCPPNTFSGVGSRECTPCESGRSAPAASTIEIDCTCDAGTYGLNNDPLLFWKALQAPADNSSSTTTTAIMATVTYAVDIETISSARHEFEVGIRTTIGGLVDGISADDVTININGDSAGTVEVEYTIKFLSSYGSIGYIRTLTTAEQHATAALTGLNMLSLIDFTFSAQSPALGTAHNATEVSAPRIVELDDGQRSSWLQRPISTSASAAQVQLSNECIFCPAGTQHFEALAPDISTLSSWLPEDIESGSWGRNLPGRNIEAHEVPYVAPQRKINITDGTLEDWHGIECRGQTAFDPLGSGGSYGYGNLISCCDDRNTVAFVAAGNDGYDDVGLWHGKDDLSGAFAIAWEPKAMYIGVKTIDDTHFCPVPGISCDHVEIHVVVAADTHPHAAIDEHMVNKLACYLLSDGSSELELKSRGLGSQCVATRSGSQNEFRYEFRLPASLFGVETLSPFMRFGVGLLYRDSDDDVPGQAAGQTFAGYAPWAVQKDYTRNSRNVYTRNFDEHNFWGQVALIASAKTIAAETIAAAETCIACPPGRFDHDAADGAVSPGSACVDCPADFYQHATGQVQCLACPRGRVSPTESTSILDCTDTPDYRGCYADRETPSDGRDLAGRRTSMGSRASLEVCVQYCRDGGYLFLGMQSLDQCHCGNSHGSYGRLPDSACGEVGDACGRNTTDHTSDPCLMRNAVFRIPARWTCSNITCGTATAKLPDQGTMIVPSNADVVAQQMCCGSTCAEWGSNATCDNGQLIQPSAAESVAAGATPQASCCTPESCGLGMWRAVLNGHCHACPAGKMSAAATQNCVQCPSKSYAPAASATCVPCGDGQFDHDDDSGTRCKPCPPGTFKSSDMDACAGICPIGTQSAAGSTSSHDCVGCSPGTHDHDGSPATPCARSIFVETGVPDMLTTIRQLCTDEWRALHIGNRSSESLLVGAHAAGTNTAMSSGHTMLIAVFDCLLQAASNEVTTDNFGCTDSLAINYDSNKLMADGSCEYACQLLSDTADYCLIFDQNDGAWQTDSSTAGSNVDIRTAEIGADVQRMLDMAPSTSVVVQGRAPDTQAVATLALLGDNLNAWKPRELLTIDLGPEPLGMILGDGFLFGLETIQSYQDAEFLDPDAPGLLRAADMKYTAMSRAIEIDGDLRDWRGLEVKSQTPFQRQCAKCYQQANCFCPDNPNPFMVFETFNGGIYEGIYDHSLAFSTAWQPDAFFLGLKIVDDTHENVGSGWNGDSIQLMFTNAARDETSPKIAFNAGLVDDTEDEAGRHIRHSENAPCSNQQNSADENCFIDTSVIRTECGDRQSTGKCIGITIYEMRFSPSSLGLDVLTPGLKFGFAINANDGDTGPEQAGQKGWSGFGPYTINFGKNAPDAGLITLDPLVSVAPTLAENRTGAELLQQLKGMGRAAWRDQYPQGGCRYEHFSNLKTWDDADIDCLKRGGHLASVHSDWDWHRIQEIAPNGQAAHLGANDRAKEMGCNGANNRGNGRVDVPDPACGWVWSDGSPWDFTFWAEGQPENVHDAEPGISDCVALRGDMQCDEMPNERQLATAACGWVGGNCNDSKPYICGFSCGDRVTDLANNKQLALVPRLDSRVHLTNNRLTLRHLLITSTTVVHGGGGHDLGVYHCEDRSHLAISHVTFKANEQAGAGAGVIFADHSVVDVKHALFQANTISGGVGAAVLFARLSNVSIVNAVILENVAKTDLNEADSNLRRRLQSDAEASAASAIVAVESVLVVEHSRLASNTGGPVLMATASVVAVTRVDFEFNSGGDIIVASGSQLHLVGTKFMENRVVAAAGRAPVSLLTGSAATVFESTFAGNVGHLAGAIFVAGATTTATFRTTQFQSNQAFATDSSAGVGFLQDGARVDFETCTFAMNNATSLKAAGALFSTESSVSLSDSNFEFNTGHGTQAGAGIIYSDASSVTTSDCVMKHNRAVGGSTTFRATHADAMWIFSPQKVHLKDTVFEPLLAGTGTVSVNPADVVYMMCELNPCPAGQACFYDKFSVTCMDCEEVFPFSHSTDGLICNMCALGTGPTVDSTGCQPCSGNNVSTYGVCLPCSAELVANDDHNSCEGCGVHRTAVHSKHSATEFSCGCEQSYHNTSLQISVCYHGSYDAAEHVQALENHRISAAATRQECDECPEDTAGDTCLICKAGEALVSPGYMVPKTSTADRRRLNEQSDAGAVDDAEVVSIFRCHFEMDLAIARCPGEAVLRPAAVDQWCAVGYTGATCNSCADDYGMSSDRVCEACEDSGYTLESIALLAGVIVGLFLVVFILGRIWKGLTIKHILRCAFQVCRSGAGYFPTLRSSLMFLVLDSHRLALMFSRFGS